jgi:hypothetical protein
MRYLSYENTNCNSHPLPLKNYPLTTTATKHAAVFIHKHIPCDLCDARIEFLQYSPTVLPTTFFSESQASKMKN